VKTIKTAQGQGIIVDDEYFDWLSHYPWYVNTKGYAMRCYRRPGNRFFIQMHREILGLHPDDGCLVDHANGNKLDNRLINLRVCTKSQNGWNQGKQRTNTTGYKGVIGPRNGKYQAQIGHLGRKKHLGSYVTAEEAYEVYCLAADMLHGEFANYGVPLLNGADQ